MTMMVSKGPDPGPKNEHRTKDTFETNNINVVERFHQGSVLGRFKHKHDDRFNHTQKVSPKSSLNLILIQNCNVNVETALKPAISQILVKNVEKVLKSSTFFYCL